MISRVIERTIESKATSDGAGVKLRRSIGSGPFNRVDPFLMLDEFYADNSDEAMVGFPPHPHRGFQTVTYMLNGYMEHRDHMGNHGEVGPGGVQWMTAGRGVIHSEMPRRESGQMRGFQLWINLPAAEKMRPADWHDIPADQIPQMTFEGGMVRVIAGELAVGDRQITGPINRDHTMATEPVFIDLLLEPKGEFSVPLPMDQQAFVYLYDGSAFLADESIPHQSACVLSQGDVAPIQAGESGARLLILSGRPLDEPIAQYGPFVMNTQEEIEQAIEDYRAGRLAEA